MAIACCVTFPRFQCVALFPAKSMVSPRTLPFCVGCVTLFAIILFLVACFLFLLVFPVTLCLGTYLLDLLCLPWPTRWVQNCSSCFSCLSALRLPSCLFVLVSQLCTSSSWRYDRSHYDPSQPCSLGTRPAHICLCFVFIFYLSSSYFTRFFGRVSWVFPGFIWFARDTG